MKRFACGDVVRGCTSVFVGETDDEILSLVSQHARNDHGLTDLPSDLVSAVQRSIVTVAG